MARFDGVIRLWEVSRARSDYTVSQMDYFELTVPSIATCRTIHQAVLESGW